jgi:hypothetical protein
MLAFVLLALVFTGCGGDDGVELMDPGETAAAPADDPPEDQTPAADAALAPGEARLASQRPIPQREHAFRVWDFTAGLSALGDVRWHPNVSAIEMSGVVEYHVSGPGPGPIMPVVDTPADRIHEIRYTLKAELAQGLKRTPVTPRTVRVLWVRDSDDASLAWPFSDERVLELTLVAEDQPGVYSARPAGHPMWNGTITQMTFDLFLPPGPAAAQNAHYAVRLEKIELIEHSLDMTAF